MEELLFSLYEVAGRFFTGRHRRRWFYAGLLLGFIICFALQLKFNFIIEQESLSWLLSSIVQSLLALIALVGVMVVFKHQSISTREDRLLEELNKETSDLGALGMSLTSTSGEGLLQIIKERVPDILGPEHGFRIVRLHKIKRELESHVFLKSFLGEFTFKLSIYIFSVTLLSLFLLVIAPLITSAPIFSLIVTYTLLFFVTDVFRLVCKVIAATLFH